MKKMWKRFVSLLLACTLLAGMLPLSASAAVSAPGEGSEQYKYAESILNKLNESITNEQEKYGLYGPALLADSELYTYSLQRSIYDKDSGKWTTDTQYILVPGVDAQNTTTPNYNGLNSGQPWAESNPSAIYIAEGVTGIGNYAFASQPSLNNVVFQDASDLTYIGQRAFYDDDNAVFTDEGNEGENATLNLSNVNKMGEYAFYNCDKLTGVKLGNMTAIEGNEEIPNKIPNNAFNNSGLQTVTIPDGIKHIGNGAFGYTGLKDVTDLVLPNGLETIGDSAFVVTMGSGETGIGITSLTIPSSVKSIGANAFSGRRNLAEVTVEDDNEPGTTLTLGDHAFGYNESSAFSEWGSITDDRTGQKYEGTMGTKFYLPADLTEKFINGTNCYTGDIEPMKWVKTQQPTCDTDGYHLYETTKKGAYDDEGKPLVLQYKYTIPMLGHDYQLKKSFSATCETNSYELWVCTRDETHTENRKIGEVSKPKGHNYQLTQVDDTEMGGGNDTTFTWVCQTKEHDDTRDSLDKTLEITIEPATIQANTSMTVGDLADMMPQVDGGKLSLAEDEKLDAALTTDTKSVRVVFTPDEVKYADYTNVGAVSEFNNADLTLEVNVSKAKLDFSDVNFGNTRVFVDSTASEGTPITVYRGSLPDDVADGKPLYSNDIGSSEEEPPARNSTWSGMVSVTFTYDPQKYEVDTEKKPGSNYTFDTPEEGKVTITHPYVIVEQTMDELAAAPIQPLTYKANEAQETVHLSGVPYSSTVSWTWEEVGNVSNSKSGIVTSPSNQNAMDIAPIMDAGTYSVTITVEKDGYEPKTLAPVTVTIAKATVVTPTAPSDLQYTGKVQTGLQEPGQDAHYEYTEGSQLTGTNAGTYKATAQLDDPDNYQWSSGDDNRDGTVEITWNIAKRRVIETSINSAYKDQTTSFTGTPITAVSRPSTTPSGFFDVEYDDEGNLVGKIKGTETVAFKISHAQETNAETYTVIASIEDFANFCWQNHPDDEDVTLGTWTIGKLQINAPTITAPDAAYDGVPYDGEVTLKHSEASGSREGSQDIIDLDKTKSNIRYYTQQTGGNGGDAPVNAGTYFAGVESNGWAFVDGKLATNYQIIRGARDPFSITKATAKMTFENPTETKTYTAQGTDLQQVTVDGLVEADTEKMETVLGDVKYTYKYSTEPNPNWESMEAQQITEPAGYTFTTVGYYQITAKWGAGTVSNNYTAADATYTLTIEKANEQKITLTSADANEGKWDEENKTYTTTYGAEASFTITGTAAVDVPVISYKVKDDSEKGPDGNTADVLDVDSGSGVVTIHKAGTATITVTAAETPNVGADSVDYTVTVEKATPTVNTNLTDNKLTVAYTGKAIEGYDKATPTANVVAEAKQPTGDITYTFYTDLGCSDENKVTNGGGEENNIPIAVGTYYMKATYSGDENYLPAESEVVTVIVTEAQLTVDAEGHTGTYDGKTHSAITIKSVTGNGTTLAQGQYTVKYAKTNTNIAPGADAGDDVWQDDLTVKDVADSSSDKLYYWYMVTADNYNPAIGKVEVKITPAPLTVTGEPASYEKEYDGDKEVDEALTDITVTAEDVPEVTIDVDATGTYVDKDAGTEKDVTLILSLTLSGTDGANIDWGNYSYGGKALTEGKITLTKAGAGTITPKAISVTGISAVDRVYDGTTKVQLTGTPGTTEGSFIGGDNVSFSAISDQTGTVTDAKAEDGKTVTVAAETLKGLLTGEDAKNYTVTQASTTTVNITKRPVTLQFPNRNDGTTEMTAPYSPQGLIVAHSDVYKVSAKTADDSTGFVGEDALAENDIQYTFTQDEQTVEKPINVGKYTVNAALTSEAAEKWSNYTIKAITGTVEIIQATEELTVTVTGKTGLTYTGQGQDPIQSISVQGGSETLKENEGYTVKFRLTDSGEYALDRNALTAAVKDAKEYTVYWQVTTTNYGNETGSFNVTVDPATLTLSSDLTKEKKYDGATEAVVTGQKVTGAQNNESITVSSVSAAYDDANVDTDKTITTTYTVTFGADVTPGNYTYTGNVEGKATSTWTIKTTVEDGKITQAPITVAINDQKKVYDGQSLSIENPVQDTHWSTTGTIYLQDGVKDDLGITLSIASGSKDAGTYAITGAASNQNYEVTFTGSWTGEDDKGKAGTYTISPRPINVQIGDAEGFYGDEPVLDNVTLDDVTEDGVSNAGLVDGEVLKEVLTGLELATIANAQSDISDEDTTYTIYAKKGGAPVQAPTQLGNYNVTFTNKGTYTVKPRPITITIVDHSSVYGAEINEGIDNPVSDKDYKVAITGNATTGDAIVNNDVLTVTLETTASAKAAAGTYDITGSAEGNKVNNYAITWAGNGGARDDEQGQNGRYTIKPAQLDIAFTQGDQVTNGVSINITDSYNANPLVLKNASTDAKVSEADKSTLDITYSIGTAGGGTGDVSQIAEIDKTTGEVTILKTGTVRITATVTPQGNSNYTGQVTTWYELNIIGGGQMALKVTPKTNLAYTGEPQELIETPICSLDSAKIQYSLDNQDWKDTIPTGTNAGTYTVYVKATDSSGQYSDVTEHVMVTIDKADLKGSFAHDPYPHVLATDGNNYDSATANPLTITSQNYKAKPANYTYYSDNMQVASSANGTSTIVITGTAGQSATIRVTVPGDDNYNGKTFTYKLEISNTLSDIQYDVTGTEATYNGQPQTIAVNVTAPASGATVMYQDKDGNYTLSEPPAYTDVKEGGYPIKFQITAPGYKTEEGTATLKIEPKPITENMIAGIAESYTYVGHQIRPETVAVVDDSVILTKDTDYTLEYGANEEVGEDKGSVIIKGTGNYTGEVTVYFNIAPVDGSSGMTASIDPAYGTYDPDGNTATVTVTHQTGTDSHEVTLTAENASYTITATDLVTGDPITERGATGTGNTLTFTKPAIYDITLTLTGDHRGEFHLSYTLLPLSNEDGGLTLTVDDETQKVFTYGDEIDSSGAAITVTADGNIVTDQCTLTYEYTGFDQTTVSGDYSPSVLKNAGVYTVTATPTEGSTITGTGTFTFLILQRDLADAILDVDDADLVFNHDEKRPSVTVTVDGNAQPTEDADYTVTYYNNVNASKEAKAVVTAKGNNFTGSNTENFSIAPKEITDEMVKEIPEQYYTGNAVIPPVTITDGNYTLILGYDYTTACDAIGPGTATVTIEGKGNYTETTTKDFVIKSEGAPEPSERFDLVVTPSQWTWGDDLTNLRLSVTFGTDKELQFGTDYTIKVDEKNFDGVSDSQEMEDVLSYIKGLKPGKYTITATGMDAYAGSTDTETVTIQKIQPTVTVTATPNSLSGGGKVTLTLKGEKLPAFAEGKDLSDLLTVKVQNGQQAPDLTELEWTENPDGSLTAELTLPNTNETYTFALRFAGNEYYEPASSNAMVVVGQQTSGGGGGSDPGDQPADPDDTGVSDWLNTKDHLAYLAGYPGGTFGPDQNMTRAEAAQMFYNLLLEKDVEITVEFEDVPADAWYAKPVNTLASLGILSGVGNGRFDPERSITRAEFTVIAMKFANTSGGGVNIFSDVNEDDWFYSAVVDSTQYGWINGYPDGTFRPEATISRAEVTVIVNHMLGRAADRPYVIAHEEELNTFGDVNRGHWGYFHVAEATNAHEYHTEDGTESWTGLS